MILGVLNSEIHVTQIEIQNEVNPTEIKKSSNSLTFVNELLKQDNAKDCDPNAEIIKVANGDAGVMNAKECGKWLTVKNLYRMETGDTNIKKKIARNPEEEKLRKKPDSESNGMDYSPDSKGNGFVLKVFAITLVMLLLTATFVVYVYTSEKMRTMFLDTPIGKFLFVFGSVGIIMLNYSTSCSPCMRVAPCNCINLLLAVVCMSLMAAYVTVYFKTDIVYNALIAVTSAVLVCFLLAFSRFDFTKFMLIFIVLSVTFTVVTFTVTFTMLFFGVKLLILNLIILYVGSIINIVVIVMELQLILSGQTVAHNEDYALAAFMLYVSLVDMFLKFLQILFLFMDDED